MKPIIAASVFAEHAFDAGKQADGKDRRADKASARAEQSRVPAHNVAEAREHQSERRRQAIGPDRVEPISERPHRVHGRRLQPVDADRLAVALGVLHADANVIVGLDHLPRRLREAGFVDVGHRHAHRAHKAGRQRDQRDQHIAAPAAGELVEQSWGGGRSHREVSEFGRAV